MSDNNTIQELTPVQEMITEIRDAVSDAHEMRSRAQDALDELDIAELSGIQQKIESIASDIEYLTMDTGDIESNLDELDSRLDHIEDLLGRVEKRMVEVENETVVDLAGLKPIVLAVSEVMARTLVDAAPGVVELVYNKIAETEE